MFDPDNDIRDPLFHERETLPELPSDADDTVVDRRPSRLERFIEMVRRRGAEAWSAAWGAS